MQIKTWRYHLTPARMPIIDNSQQTARVGEGGRRENPCALLVGMYIGAATWKNSVDISLKKKKNRAAI